MDISHNSPPPPIMDIFAAIDDDDMETLLFKYIVTDCTLDPINFNKVKLDFMIPTLIPIINNCFALVLSQSLRKRALSSPELKIQN